MLLVLVDEQHAIVVMLCEYRTQICYEESVVNIERPDQNPLRTVLSNRLNVLRS